MTDQKWLALALMYLGVCTLVAKRPVLELVDMIAGTWLIIEASTHLPRLLRRGLSHPKRKQTKL